MKNQRHLTLAWMALLLAPLSEVGRAQSADVRAMTVLQPGDSSIDLLVTHAEFPLTLSILHDAGRGLALLRHVEVKQAFSRVDLGVELVEGERLRIEPQVSHSRALELAAHIRRGDVNCDGRIDRHDVAVTSALARGGSVKGPFNPMLADVDGTGRVDVRDAQRLADFVSSGRPHPVPVRSGADLCPGRDPSACIPQLIKALTDPFETAEASYAYHRLWTIGDDAVAPLLEAAAAARPTDLHVGESCFHPMSSIQGPAPPRVAAVCLVLVEAIRRGVDTPFERPELLRDEPGLATDTDLAAAVAVYQNWDAAYAGIPVEQRPAPALPNDVTFATSWPPLPPIVVPYPDGTEVPDTDQRPLHPGVRACSTVTTTPYVGSCWQTVVYGPLGPEWVKQTNCFAHAACLEEIWVEPDPQGTAEDFVMGLGLDPDSVSTVDTPGSTVMIAWDICPNGTVIPVHAMKRSGVKWTSKNGQNSLWVDICDPEAFAEHFFPPGEGKTRVYLYFTP